MNYLTDQAGVPIADANPLPIKLSGSNTRKTVSDTILFGGATLGAHHAGDILSVAAGEILQFDTGFPAGSSGIILSSLVTLNQDAVFAGGAGYTLHLWNVTQTPIADNAAFSLASLTGYIGKIDISTLVDYGAMCAVNDVGHNLDFTLAAGDTKLYGMLVCKGSDTTIDAKTMTINLGIAAL